jgi:hypothetical protein
LVNSYSEFEFYSPILDSVCLRVSVSDGHIGEFFAIVPKPSQGSSLRELRNRVLNAIEAAMEANLLPGEVKIDLDKISP